MARVPYGTCAVVGLGGLFAGVTGPLLSAFVPLLVQAAIGERPTAIGGVMAIDNVLLLLLVPWAGAASDRASAHGRGRLGIVLTGFVMSSAGMALFASPVVGGAVGLIASMVLLYTGINVQRAPFQALVADAVPSQHRSFATGSVTFQMCVGAIVFLGMGQVLGMRAAFLIAAGTVLAIAVAFALGLRKPAVPQSQAAEASYRSLVDAAWTAVRGDVAGMRAIFLASFLLQLTFQTFTTWFSLHGTERFGLRPEDVTIGMIAWAVGGVIGALPAGVVGTRIGRRNGMLVGFALMAVCLFALNAVSTIRQAVPLLALASAAWTFPTVSAYPLFVEPVPKERRGILSALFLLCMALGGAIGDPLNGAIFDLAGSYQPLFLLMGAYTALAFVAVLFIPRGTGEAPMESYAPARATRPLWRRLGGAAKRAAYRVWTPIDRVYRPDPLLPPAHLRVYYYRSLDPKAFHAACQTVKVELVSRGLQPHHRVLDIGSGIGNLAIPLLGELRGGYDGMEIHPEAVAWCQRAITPGHPSFRFHRADVANSAYNPGGAAEADRYRFPFPDRSFDFIYLGSVFTHMPVEEVAQYVREIARLLAPAGQCIASFFLLNGDSRGGIDAGASFMPFGADDATGRFRLHDAAVPGAAIAIDEGWVRALFAREGLVMGELRRGRWWSGVAHDQDIVTARPVG